MSVVAALQPVVEALEQLGVAYHIGGSVASSAHGSPRATNDVDVVVDLRLEHVPPLCAALADRSLLRYVERTLAPDSRAFRFATAEDILLRKLEWYRDGGEQSDRQWADVLGLVRTRAGDLDRGYLAHWAPQLGVEDLLARAEREAEPG